MLIQMIPVSGADQAAIRQQAKLPDTKPLANAIGHGNQRRHIRGVARPHLTTDGIATIVQHDADHHPAKGGDDDPWNSLFDPD